MKLHYDEATEAFRAELVDWLEAHRPSDEEMLADPPQSSAHQPTWARRWQRQLFDAGWLVPGWPPELGGRHATPVQQLVYFEELARLGIPRTVHPQGLSIIAPSLVDFGTDEQRERYALPVLRAEITGCLGMSEPGAGSDLAGLSTRADVDGDHFVVNGQKLWMSGAHHADFCLCFVRTDHEAPKHKGISALLVDMSSPGITTRLLPGLTDPAGGDFTEVFFADVVVPRQNLVGELNRGWAVANGSLAHERGMLWVDTATGLERAVESLVAFARERGVGDDRLVRDRVAELYVDAQALRFMGYRGFAKITRGQASPEHSILKLFGSETARRVYLTRAEAMGAGAVDVSYEGRHRAGLQPAEDAPPLLRYFGSFAGTIAGGTSEIQRNIVAERVLGLPRR